MQKINIGVNKQYDVIIESGIFRKIENLVADKSSKICIITDDIVGELYGHELNMRLNRAGVHSVMYQVPHGEHSKSIANFATILEFLAENDFTRNDIIIALGGGVIGDLAGFIAASYMRGIRLIQLPTTLLAAIDSSVGGKTALNLPLAKNIVGTFHQPIACYIDVELLKTLPEREWQCGLGEGLKYAILEGGRLMEMMQSHQCMDNLDEFIGLCVSAKAKYVSTDEYDVGSRMLLNLGHTYGHSIEAASSYETPHGIAVAEGLRYSLDISQRLSVFNGDATVISGLLDSYGVSKKLDYARLTKWLVHDKKASGTRIKLVLIEDIGKCALLDVDIEDLIKMQNIGMSR